MTDKEFNLKLEELQLKHEEAEKLQAHRVKLYIYWIFGATIGTIAVTATVTTLLLKYLS